ncbi:hypothetical protein N867_06535 [Actinotalea fermentans ATCC 43279 = JCM 9966 = DSM 3133]|uniref:PASTA domain-containing protein n=2 Tax=Actinotalea fermentans TaxID=43671 RepID=A0A511YU23_9CELL|nr:hypothetical protein N867_06535 [Actinotalea fermentans ATCC 43279 = JCM 9966 = DSM 3133]GEN78692.1 hypothetical protein AFE02nite_04260 [Actinotalea fermentans]
MEPDAQDPTVRGRWWLVVAVIAALVPALGGGVWWYLAAGPGAFTSVPDGIAAATLADARGALDDAGLEVATVDVFHPTAPAGAVVALAPTEGEQIRKGGLVTLTISRGPDLRAVFVEGVGQAVASTEAALAVAGLVPETQLEYSDTVPAGTVIAMALADGTPVAKGDKIPRGTEVVLTCSDGPAPVTIPNIVGLTRDAALAALAAAGLQVAESQAYHPDVPAGIVKLQDPAAGAEGHRLDTVSMVVSLGPEPPPPPPANVVVPSSVIGMTKFPALDLLGRKGFDARYERGTCTVDWAQCVVEKTVPAAGTSQPKGSKVTIWLTNPAGTPTGSLVVPAGLVGMTKFPALDLLSSTGFTPAYERNTCTVDWSECVVEYTVPAAGTTAPAGSTVTIWLRNP